MGNANSSSKNSRKTPSENEQISQIIKATSHHATNGNLKNVPRFLKPLAKTEKTVQRHLTKKRNRKNSKLKHIAQLMPPTPIITKDMSVTPVSDIYPTSYKQKWIYERHFSTMEDVDRDRLLPTDSPELERNRIQSYIFNWAFSGNLLAPVENELIKGGVKVIDIGCGIGSWVVDMALAYPKSQYVGIDHCDIFLADIELPIDTKHNQDQVVNPTHLPQLSLESKSEDENDELVEDPSDFHSEVLSPKSSQEMCDTPHEGNVIFQVSDVLEGLYYPDNTFTLVNVRQKSLVFTNNQWEKVMTELLRVTKPGGYIQILESEINLKIDNPSYIVKEVIHKLVLRGFNIDISSYLNQLLDCAGFIDIGTRYVSIPIGSWGFEIGTLWKQNLASLVESLKPSILPGIECTEAEWDLEWKTALQKMEDEMKFTNIHVAWARKPLENEEKSPHWENCDILNTRLSYLPEVYKTSYAKPGPENIITLESDKISTEVTDTLLGDVPSSLA
ncbi:hypothetical protein F4703DRAFT_1872822 [Phycomyces blakesleeanus]